MQLSLPLLAAFFTFTSCSINRAPSLNLLEKRSDYQGSEAAKDSAASLRGSLYEPRRTETKTTDVYVHPHELPGGDYFMGGYIRAIVVQPRWDMDAKDEPTLAEPEKPTFTNTHTK